MNGKKIVILHLTFDGILFDQVYPRFEAMEGYENRYLLGAIGYSKQFKFIKNSEKIIRVNNYDEWKKIISDPQVDIIYLHGLWKDYLKAVDIIQNKVKVMWWCYGKEIYENVFGRPALMGFNIYKPKTLHYYLSSGPFYIRISQKFLFYCPKLYVLFRWLFDIVFKRPGRKLRKMLSRIDYVFTPLEMELDELKKKQPFIKGKPYRLVGVANKDVLVIHNQMGHLLLEHSAQISNNHLDVLDSIKEKQLDFKGRNIYVPLSYGVKKLAERVKEESKLEGASVHCLMEPLPYKEYSEMMSSCTHAIFGMLRQSGLGNIYSCFQKGIKVFFFKDSLLYKYFKSEGFFVFSIEDDLNDISIREPLKIEQAQNNYDKFNMKFNGSADTYEQQFDKILKIVRND